MKNMKRSEELRQFPIGHRYLTNHIH